MLYEVITERFFGPTLMRDALAKSRNVVTIKILQDIGVEYAIEYAKKMGITSELSKNLSIALGSSGVSLLELTKAYSVFANQGYLIEPVFIVKIEDRITSYNVCYTKLLRQNQRQPQF